MVKGDGLQHHCESFVGSNPSMRSKFKTDYAGFKMFDYPYTCPKIDKNIEQFKGSLENFLESLVQDLNPMYADTEQFKSYVQNKAEEFYEEVEPLFEDVREANSNLRNAAEHQLTKLQQQVEQLESQIE